MKLSAVLALVVLIFCGLLAVGIPSALAATTDDVADALVLAGKKTDAHQALPNAPADLGRGPWGESGRHEASDNRPATLGLSRQ